MKIFDFNLFKKKKEEQKPVPKVILSDEEKFNVEGYNQWFKTIYSGYSGRPGAPGIFLRMDKLDYSMVSDWFEYLNTEYTDADIRRMTDLIREDWREKLSKQ